jgi:hypothetical protein
MRETVSTVRNRFRARRFQRWSEVTPEDDWVRSARVVTIAATVFFALIVVAIVLALVLR